ncbi:sensor histidine kinase [Salipaludibacillus agaradhaerens]|uniref:sensor histidine kinase n=1 Tax=Salipaludibacillus agaradhaerens TaxID=76935 RepID=UPI002150F813|nr:sensor histidine kinase [Salipaludibacillus agaradhaerens]MCR6108514.1 sensor histidine kinase [Salipaludibacillus agaradhaerens]MCR6120535.1 sensor histidine kinase [Salipaludibacillus agaradhaerens]UJW59543.1 sensor histidine kinase [Bacillus sp. A116_S68]
MTIFLVSIIFILLTVVLLQVKAARKKQAQLQYVQEKLKQILTEKTDEKLILQTDDITLKLLLIEMNRLLEYNQKVVAKYNRMEIAKRKMLSNISHDLKTPLTVVLGCMEIILGDANLSEKERKAQLEKVYRKSQEVLDLINKFFDLVKLESGDQDMPILRLDVNEICRNNILSFYDILTSKGFDVDISIPEQSLYIFANEMALNRILQNLISNAIRYGSDGNIIGIEVRYDEEALFIDIWDQGKGIQAIDKDQVFERMFTLEDSRNKQYQGSGLGLTITKRLVEEMGGEISLSSIPFEKTTFTIQFRRVKY